MKLDIPDGYMKVEKPREKTCRLKAEGVKRFREATENGVRVRRADYGRQMIYHGERAALNIISTPVRKMTLEELTEKANLIFADERVKNIDPYPGEKIYVENSCKNGAIAYSFQRRMRFGTTKDNFTLYHEAAHILTPGNKHGYEFCHVMCMLIEWFESKEAAEHMRGYLHVCSEREGGFIV